MSIVRKLKSDPTIRGWISLYKEYFGIRRSRFGYIADNVTLTPPGFCQIPIMYSCMGIMD